MTFKRIITRVLVGAGLLVVLLALGFTLILESIKGWGATDAEVVRTLPGDELLARPVVSWTNAETIDASPDQVWPWIAQIGDTRGGYYSYTFIENQVGSITGAEGYDVVYKNADTIVPEWQQPQVDQQIIQGLLKIREVQPGEWLLADTIDPEALGWSWLWYLEPLPERQTRLIVRARIQPPGEAEGGVMGFMMNVGGFVMQQNMMQGIKVRAEGGGEPAYIESVEVALWVGVMLVGLVSGGFYLFQQAWRRPLAVALAAVVILLLLTIAQPAVWLRLLLFLLLLAGLWWARHRPAAVPMVAWQPPVAG